MSIRKASLVMPILLVMWSAVFQAQGAAAVFFVANPADSFGSVKLGAPPPLFPTITCEDSTLGVKMFFAELGLSVWIRDQGTSDITGLPANVIGGIEAERVAQFFPGTLNYNRGCKVQGGQSHHEADDLSASQEHHLHHEQGHRNWSDS